ncbi:hypothetical protein JL720_11585 [Aureococcus anophagefferens]|nr:hypothetical protein JL720_11585 [Aureococcus anophagefferens]
MATLVTGADTPLGYAVARALLAAGQEVVALVAPEPRGPVCACLVATDGPHAGERFALGIGPAPRFVGRSAAHGEGGVCLGRDGSASGTHARDRGAGVVAVRLFDVYGGDADCGAAPAPGLASLARTLAGGGADERERTYCGDASHVSEAATWLVAALERAGHTRGFVAVNGAAGHLARGPDVARAASRAERGEVGRRRSDSAVARRRRRVAAGPARVAAGAPARAAARGPRQDARAPRRRRGQRVRPRRPRRLLAEDRAADRRLRHLKPLESRAAPSPASLVARVASFLLAPSAPRATGARGAGCSSPTRPRGASARRGMDARGRRRPFSWLYGRAGVWRNPVALASVGAAADETRSALTATRIGGAVYCFGGLDAAGEPTNDVRARAADATLGEWRPVATTGKPPAPRFGHGAAPWAGAWPSSAARRRSGRATTSTCSRSGSRVVRAGGAGAAAAAARLRRRRVPRREARRLGRRGRRPRLVPRAPAAPRRAADGNAAAADRGGGLRAGDGRRRGARRVRGAARAPCSPSTTRSR